MEGTTTDCPIELYLRMITRKLPAKHIAKTLAIIFCVATFGGCLDVLPPACDILIGGFPCQDVSINGKRQADGGERTILYRFMVETIKQLNPRVFVAENVRGLLAGDFGRQVLSDFEIEDYAVTANIYTASEYGVPQKRDRLFIIGVRGDKCFFPPGPENTSPTTCEQAIGDLAGLIPKSEINHIWSNAKASPGQGSRRLKANAAATTMRAEHHGNVQWHYSLDRRISLREQARLQSFPDQFDFPCGMRETERQIGNAVPPVMAWHGILPRLFSNRSLPNDRGRV